MKKNIIVFIAIILLTGISGCEKLFIEPDPKNTPEECFESLWQRIDEKYSFLEYKNINWDSIKNVYRPKVYNGMTQDSLFKVLDAMLYHLKDGHVNLIAPFNVSRNWEWYLGYPQNFDRGLLERNYWGNDYYITGPFVNQVYLSGGKKIGYFYYESFSSNFSDSHLDFILNRFKSADGLIIDMRNNGGGLTTNVYRLLNRFVSSRVLVGRNYEKSGPGHSDFTLSYEMYAEPSKDSKGNTRILFVNKPIVILTNRSCYSACNMFAGFMSVLPNVTIVGDQSGGGGGLPVSFQLPNGWIYRFSSTYVALPNGLNIEGGIPVDVAQDMSPGNQAIGIDDIFEEALLQF